MYDLIECLSLPLKDITRLLTYTWSWDASIRSTIYLRSKVQSMYASVKSGIDFRRVFFCRRHRTGNSNSFDQNSGDNCLNHMSREVVPQESYPQTWMTRIWRSPRVMSMSLIVIFWLTQTLMSRMALSCSSLATQPIGSPSNRYHFWTRRTLRLFSVHFMFRL